MPSITIIGTGYVGLVSGACLANFGNSVVCVDVDEEKIERLKKCDVPIYEPGLSDLVSTGERSGRLRFSTSLEEAVKKSEVVFIAVGTPESDDGAADLSYVENAARQIGAVFTGYKVIVDKSTVPIGTGKKVKAWINEELDKRFANGSLAPGGASFDVVSNPEFLREGAAVYDFTHPDRIVIGSNSEKSRHLMKAVYRSLYLNDTPYIETSVESAEMIKYASNAFLAVKISFINEIALLCEKVGAEVQDVAKAMGRDGRIGPKFLHAGPGYGGSCFPKDTKALAGIGRSCESPLHIVEAAIKSNERQKAAMVQKIEEGLGSVRGKTIAVLGLSFKPNTDDVREAPSISIIRSLVKKGAVLRLADPVAAMCAESVLKDEAPSLAFFQDEYKAVCGADAIALVTEWNQYRNLNLDEIKNLMSGNFFFDLRNVYKRRDVEGRGFRYFGVGG
ncbi:MAG: UDP-glucose/GDP-mannose dehydrogenase family protein [Spirochaetaceae bacterium]|jgi:UDPglucose 6-dehydrogenase|nr:UDP-glucose/GDP-mannose dehydrogenase family protein [Spirochaetaceae bacterium]